MKLLLVFCFLCISTASVFAYIDPGTGSYVVQLLIAASISAVFILKSQWKKFRDFIALKLGNKPEKED